MNAPGQPTAYEAPDAAVEPVRAALEQSWGQEYGKHITAAESAFYAHAQPGEHFDQIMTSPASTSTRS